MSIEFDTKQIVKQGWLAKKSKHLGIWRSRWTVITNKHLFTFKDKNMNTYPTSKIQLYHISKISSISNLILRVKGKRKYFFKAKTEKDATEWIECIKKYKHRYIKTAKEKHCGIHNNEMEIDLFSRFKDKIDGMSEREKDIVNGFIRSIKEIYIPLDIHYLIYLFYNYYFRESFSKYTDGMLVYNDDKTLINLSGKPCTAYGDIILNGNDLGIHIWKITINKLNKERKMMVGIDCNGSFYGFECDGFVEGFTFNDGDTFIISYDTVTRILAIHDEIDMQQIYGGMRIDTKKDYHLAITLYAKNDELSVNQYIHIGITQPSFFTNPIFTSHMVTIF